MNRLFLAFKVIEISSESEKYDSDADTVEFECKGDKMVKTNVVSKKQQDLLNKIDELSKRLPPNTLDELIEKLGGPNKVAVSE